MRILHITPFFYPSMGGIQTYVEYLSKNLKDLGHDVDILTLNSEEIIKKENYSNLNIYRCNVNLKYHRGLLSFEFMRKIFKMKDYDIYHVHIPFPLGLEFSIMASKLNKIPLIVTHHGEPQKDLMVYSLINNSYSKFYRHISLRFINNVIFLTKDYSKSFNIGINNNKIKIVKGGVDTNKFSPIDRNESRERLGFDKKENILLFVGDLSKHNKYKGVDYLINAFKEISNSIDDIKLVIVGKGELLKELKTLAEKLNLTKKIIFVGSVNHDDLPQYYAISDLFILPSISGPESFGIVLVEAMAMERAVIATKIPGVREIVLNNENGILVNPKDTEDLSSAIIALLKNPNLKRKFEKKSFEIANKDYNWKKISKQISRIYEDSIN